ncbi:MAG: peptidase E [Thermoleophilaceae bacterium]|nr:peptidase E [Thermoleophilaceae bacterium]
MSPAGSRRRILALGGGGFTSSAEDWPLDELTASLTSRPTPRICLLPTASGDPEEQIRRFYAAFEPLGCELSHISLFRLGTHPVNLREHLLSRDVIYVGGGSLLNLLALWRVHGVDALLCEAWQLGVALCGVSAGSMCWFEAGVTRTYGRPSVASGLSLLRGSNSVHYGGDPVRRAAYRSAVAEGIPGGYAVEDGVALLFAGQELVDVVSSRPGARAYRVQLEGGALVERPLEAREIARPPGSLPSAPVSLVEFREAAQRRSRASRNSLRSIPPV